MNKTVFLIIFASILLLTIKYLIEFKPYKILLIVLILFMITSIGFISNYFLDQPILLTIGAASGMIIAPLIFSIYLLKNTEPNNKNLRLLMLLPTIGLLIHWIFKFLNMKGLAVINLAMIPLILVGLFIIFNKNQIKEIKPFQIILIFLIIDLITFVTK